MSCEQPDSNADHGDGPAAPSPGDPEPGQLAGTWLIEVAFGLVGGLVAWGLFQALYPIFTIPAELADIEMPNSKQSAELLIAEQEASLFNAVLILGWTGALLAGAMAAGEAWARRSWRMALAGVVGCALAGALSGGVAGWVGHTVYYWLLIPFEGTTSLRGTVVVQMTMLAVLGGGIGLAMGSLTGCARGAWTRLLAGVLAGVFAGMIYPTATAYLFPATHTDYIIPRDDTGALLWLMTTAVLLGFIIPEMKLRRTGKTNGKDQLKAAVEDRH
jgi:hypothetical protein